MFIRPDDAVALLDSAEVVGVPTETVYGLAARIDKPAAVEKIFSTKARPFFDPLIVHVRDAEQARSLVLEWPRVAEVLAARFWPGPLTLVLPKSAAVSSMITSGLETVGLRCPRHPIALELLRAPSAPFAAPSANRFGRTSPTTAQHVEDEFEGRVPVIDGGACDVGIESTILSVVMRDGRAELQILRKGAISASQISEVLHRAGVPFHFSEAASVAAKVQAPGQIKHHYMPAIPLVYADGSSWTEEQITKELVKALPRLPKEVQGVKLEVNQSTFLKPAQLGLPSDPARAARLLYSELRRIAQSGADHIYFLEEEIHRTEPWQGIIDRLQRASIIKLN